MVGHEPTTPVNIMVLWMGKLLKDATSVEVKLEVLESHCAGLEKALSIMHEEVKDANMLKARKQAAKEARDKRKGEIAFNVGDLVVVGAVDNAANIIRKSKIMVTWQGPYEVVRRASAVEYDVRLLGDPVDRVKPIHWTMMKRYAGPDFGKTIELIASAQHDQQKFYVESLDDWRQTEAGVIELLVTLLPTQSSLLSSHYKKII